ncbi:alpha/beta fold hydrolase [Plastoroseomonas hellenica]|nr:alpha/beta hydrolase [Plastoroseomonas hellenica]
MSAIATLPARAADAPSLARRPGPTADALLRIGTEAHLLCIRDGVLLSAEPASVLMPRYDFALIADAAAWSRFISAAPQPGWHDLMALLRQGGLRAEGNLHPFMAHLGWFKALFALLRPALPPSAAPPPTPVAEPFFEPIAGRYLHLMLQGAPHRLYVEEAGEGIPLILLHTAGSDGRQWRDLMNDAEVTRHFRCIAFDMPWHGKSSPPEGFLLGEYRLTTSAYTGMVMAVATALRLDRPVVMGCSIGGRIVLDLAAEHADSLRAVIGLQSSAFVAPYYDTAWLHHPEVHGGEVCAAIVSGLVGPTAPEAGRAETLWHYRQGGPGVFRGDLHFYKGEGDLRPKLARIDTGRCPVHLLTGDYDYSCRPEDTQATAAAIPGAEAVIMPGLGHFPMSENWPALRTYLLPVLERIRATC